MGKGEKGAKDLSFKIFIGKITKYFVIYFQICAFCGKKGQTLDLTNLEKDGIILQSSDETQGRKDDYYE